MNTSNENLTASYLQHREESDQIIHEIREAFAINKTYHDGLSEAQTIIGRLELEILILRQELHRASLTING